MDPVTNPYAPGAGRSPAALVGRDSQSDEWRVALARIERGKGTRSLVLNGLRGVGKTVLLSSFEKFAEEQGWLVAWVEAGVDKPLRPALGESLRGPLTDLAKPSAGQRVQRALKTALSFFTASYNSTTGAWTIGLDLSDAAGGGADTGTLEYDLPRLVADLSAVAAERHRGLAILIDEAQDLTKDELTAVCSCAHQAAQRGWHFIFALAGLPSLPRVLAEAKSYSERLFNFQPIGQLDNPLAKEALVQPALAEGVEWDQDALAYIVERTSGYPYFLQQYGQDTWEAAEGERITYQDARVGAAKGSSALDNGFFRTRWDRATSKEQDYMRSMAVDGDGGSSSGAVAQRLNRSISSLGPARAGLINKGLVYAPEYGIVAFTVPGMADFIMRQPE